MISIHYVVLGLNTSMLQFLVIAVAFTLAGCQDSPRVIETTYKDGKEYIYNYESQMLSGLPVGGKTWSGLKLLADIHVQAYSPWKFKLQMRSPRLYKVNDFLDSHDPTKEMLPIDLFTELVDDDAEKMKLTLVKPASFSYVRGHVDDLVTEKEDPEWSVNIKRGILSLLEINFNERHSLSRDVPVLLSDNQPKTYKVIEPSVVGECETRYRVVPERSVEDVPSMMVQKLRDHDKCIEKIVHTWDILNSHVCDTCDRTEKFDHITSQSSVRYQLFGSPDQFIILNAVGESQYSFAPYSPNLGAISAFSNQTLTLINSRPISDQISDPSSPMLHEQPLKIRAPGFERSELSPWTYKITKEEEAETLKMVKKMLTGIEQLMAEKVDEGMGDIMSELSRLLKTLGKPSLDSIWDYLSSNIGKLPSAWKVFIDILPNIGTYPSVDVLLEKMEKGDIPKDRCPMAMMSLSLLPRPDVFMVKRLVDFLEMTDVKRQISDKLYRRSAWLTLGSLGDKMAKVGKSSLEDMNIEWEIVDQLRSESNDRLIRRKLDARLEEIDNKRTQLKELYTTTRKTIVNMVQKLLELEDGDSRKLSMKVMASLGYEEFTHTLESIVRNITNKEQTRVEAAISMYDTLKTDPKMVEKIYLPLCFDPTQPDIVRMIAFSVVLFAGQSRSSVELIVKSLEKEPNDNIASYVYSSLMELSKLSTPCDELKSLAQNSTLAKRFSKPPTALKSYMMAKSSYNDNLQMGQTYTQSVLYSPNERSPSFFVSKYTAALLGKSTDVFEFVYNGKGFDNVLSQLLDVSAGTSLESMLKTFLHPRQRRGASSNNEQKIQDIKKKIGVKPRDPGMPDGYISFRLFGHELIYFDTESYFSTLFDIGLENGQGFMDRLKEKLSLLDGFKTLMGSHKSLLLPVWHAVVPTELGLPIKLQIDSHAMFRFDGDVKPLSNSRSSEKSLFDSLDALFHIRPSGLFEIQGRLEVDMKHVSCGVGVKGKMYADVPLTMKISYDPAKSKLLLQLQDEKELTPMKLESHARTEMRRYPSTADKYPIPPEWKEVSHIDGCDSKVVMYEFGKDVLGRSFKMMGMRSVRKDSSVPLPPMSGKQEVYFKYKPMSDTGLHIQIQHVRDSDYKPKGQNESPRTGSGWFPFSWFSSSSEEQEPRGSSSYESRDSSQNRYSTDNDFIDLEEKDLSIPYLESKMTGSTDILESGSKCGMVIHIVDSDPQPKHEIQMSTFYQTDHSDRKIYYTVEIRRRPTPDEENPWKMVTDMRLEIPEQHLEPSDLLDNEYQKQIQEQIRMSVTENGKQVDSLYDFWSQTLNKVTRQLNKFGKPNNLHDSIEALLDHVLQNSMDSDSKPFTDAVQKQRKVFRDLNKFQRQPVDPQKMSTILKIFEKILKESKSVTDKLSSMLSQITNGQQNPEDAVKVLYVLSKKDKANNMIRKFIAKLHPILSHAEIKKYEEQLKEQENDLEIVKDQQRKHSMAKQPSELQKSRLEVGPADRSLHSKLLELEQKLVSLSEMQSKYMKDGGPQDHLHTCKKNIKLIILASNDVKDSIDETLLQKSALGKMLRVKIFEVLLHHRLALYDIDNDIMFIEMKSRTMGPKHLTIPADDFEEDLVRELVRQKTDLKRKASQIARRLMIAVDVEKDSKSSNIDISSSDVEKLATLTKIQVQHLKVLEDLNTGDTTPLPVPDPVRSQPSKESMQKYVDIVTETSKTVKDIVDQESSDIKLAGRIMLDPVLMKCLKVFSGQLYVLKYLKEATHQRIFTKTLMEDPELSAFKDLRLNIRKLEEETVGDIRRTENILMMKFSPESDLGPEYPVQSDSPLPLSKMHVPLTMLFKKVSKVEVHHSELRSLQYKFVSSLDQPMPSEKSSQLSKFVYQKQLLYDIISKLLVSQDDLDWIQEHLQQKVEEQPDREQVKEFWRVVTDKQADQLGIVKTVEKKLIDRSRSDLSLIQPLQTIQQIKDRIQRQQHNMKLLHQPDNRPHTPSQGRSPKSSTHTSPLGTRSPGQLLNKDIKGMVKIIYGVEGKERKTITCRMFGKKSLKQLLWEHDQSLPSMQDPLIHQYFRDRLEPNDPAAMGYQAIKDKLNAYRHLHVFVAYEDSLPVYVRQWMWMLHEMLKLKFYPKTELVMPDESNMRNKLEMKSDLSFDNKWINLEIKTPSETTRFWNIRTPDMVKQMSLSSSWKQNLLTSVCTRHLTATCEVTPDRVKIFTGRTIEADLMSQPCESVLTMDCSPSNTMAITSKPYLQDPSRKIITVMTKERRVEIIPDQFDLKVNIDNQHITMPTQPDTIRMFPDSNSPVIVRKILDDRVEIRLPHIGLSLITDGQKASVMVPQTYWSKLCGVCGSMDNHQHEDLIGPQAVKYMDPKPFASTYLVPGQTCDPKPIHSRVGIPEIREKSKHVVPVEKTQVREKMINGIPKTCFSITPVKKCPPGSSPEGIENHLVSFYCLRTKSSKTKVYQKLAESRVLYEVKDKRQDMNENITMPKHCIKQ